MHTVPAKSASSPVRAFVYALVGLLGGALYAVINTRMDAMTAEGTDLGWVGSLHGVVDRGIPLFTGMLVGICVHYLQLRSALARMEAARAQVLHDRLHRVERDQAVWLVAAATLHDVSNPLHSLGLLLDELTALGAGDDATRSKLLASARVNTDRISERLAALKLAADEARPRSAAVDLHTEVAQIADEMRPLALEGQTNLSYAVPGPVRARGDALFVRIILENLLRNAIDAVRDRADEGRVGVEVSEGGTSVTVSVCDNGPGISTRDDSSLFEPALSSKAGGMGLGLPIASALARAMGGELSLGSRADWRTSFVLTLPKDAT